MKIREVESFLKNKLGFVRSDAKKHIHFIPPKAFSLPFIVSLSHGSGDIAPNNLIGISKALGITKNELIISTKCNICSDCIYIFLSIYLLNHIKQKLNFDPIVHADALTHMRVSVDSILNDISKSRNITKKWNQFEKDSFERIKSDINILKDDKNYSTYAYKIEKLIMSRMEDVSFELNS